MTDHDEALTRSGCWPSESTPNRQASRTTNPTRKQGFPSINRSVGTLPSLARFDVAMFWISPRRGLTNQPRATPGELEFPRKTSPENPQQGVGDVAPLTGSGECVAM